LAKPADVAALAAVQGVIVDDLAHATAAAGVDVGAAKGLAGVVKAGVAEVLAGGGDGEQVDTPEVQSLARKKVDDIIGNYCKDAHEGRDEDRATSLEQVLQVAHAQKGALIQTVARAEFGACGRLLKASALLELGKAANAIGETTTHSEDVLEVEYIGSARHPSVDGMLVPRSVDGGADLSHEGDTRELVANGETSVFGRVIDRKGRSIHKPGLRRELAIIRLKGVAVEDRAGGGGDAVAKDGGLLLRIHGATFIVLLVEKLGEGIELRGHGGDVVVERLDVILG